MPIAPPAPIFRGPDAAKQAKLAGSHSIKAVELYDEILASTARLRDNESRHHQAIEAMHAAEQEMYAQVQRAEHDPAAEAQRDRDLQAARIAARPELHMSRQAGEEARLREAIDDYKRFAVSHAHDLLAESTPDAEKRTEELARSRAATHQPEINFHEVRDRMQTIVDLVRGPRPHGPLPGEVENAFGLDSASQESHDWAAWNLPADESVPLPDAGVVARHAALFEPVVA